MTQTGWDADLVCEVDDAAGQAAPDLRGDQVAVDVEACGVCHRDIIDRDGRFKFIRIPVTPGHELVGRVVAVGPAAADWVVGDRVGAMHRDACGRCPACQSGETSSCAVAAAVPGLTIDGGYASRFVAAQSTFFRVPDDVPAAEAAVMHCTYGTAYRALRRRGELEPGQRALITGANGGVGAAAVQVAKRLGADVIAVVRDATHGDFVRELGADDVVVDPGDADGRARFHKQLGGKPVDVALDCVGEPTFNAALRSLRIGGRLVVIGNVVEARAALNLGFLVTRALSVFGSAGATRDDMAELFALHAERPFDMRVEALDLARADEAQRRVRAGGMRGRLVLLPG